MTLVDAATGEVLDVMSEDEARTITDLMRTHRDELWRLAIESHDRAAHLALGFSSWRQYMEAELGVKSSRAYQILDHGRTMLALGNGEEDSTIVESLPANEAQARPLAKLETDAEKRETWRRAREMAAAEGRSPTAKDVEQAAQPTKTTTTERITETRQTVRENAPEPKAPVDEAADRIADSDAVYREMHSKARVKARDLLQLDPERCAQLCVIDERTSHEAFVERARDWIDRFDKALHGPSVRGL